MPLLRFLQFCGVLAVVGSGVLALLVLPRARRGGLDAALAEAAARRAWRLIRQAGILLLLVAVARLAERALGPGVGDAGIAGLPRTAWGKGWLLGALGAAAAWLSADGEGEESLARPLWALAAAALLVGLPLGGHASELDSIPAMVADALHGLGAGGWIGTLAALTWCGMREAATRRDVRDAAILMMVRAFSPVALGFAAMAALTGTVNALGFLGAGEGSLDAPYAVVLWAKLGALVLTAGIGAYNWRVVTPRLGTERGSEAIAHSARAELVVALVVLALTAVLVGLPAPALAP